MTQGAIHGMFDIHAVAPHLDRSSAPRDKNFKLVDLAFLQILPVARARHAKLSFVSVGFDGEVEAKLHGVYSRHDISGAGLSAYAPSEECDDFLLTQTERLGPTSARFQCLSVLGCAAGRHVLDMVCRGAFRPGLVHCADRDTFEDWPSFRAALTARRYACVGELEGAEIFIDVPLFDAPDERPRVASFDVFDTLIARRCLEPWRIFERVGELAGISDFVVQRRGAEGRVIEKMYVFDDIYDELGRHYGWPEERRREVQALELFCEREAVIPIAENLSRVRDGDLLVSDTYLDEHHLRSLLERAGLTANVGLLVESHGKSSARVWPVIDAQFKVTGHVGSDPHADVTVPARFGLTASITRSSALNLVERTLLQSELRDLALLCREARLSTWHEDPSVRALQSIQASLNLPLLILASVSMSRRAAALGKTSIAFCSRDGSLWRELFDRIQAKMGLDLETSCFLSSRAARNKASDAYIGYARRKIGAQTLVVDLGGTGSSMANLAERLGPAGCDVFFIDHRPPVQHLDPSEPTPSLCRVHPLFAKRPNANTTVLDLANTFDHASVGDMRAVGATFVPVFTPNPLSMVGAPVIDEQRRCFLAGLDLIDNYPLNDVFELDDPSIAFLCAALYEYMSKQTGCFQTFTQKVPHKAND